MPTQPSTQHPAQPHLPILDRLGFKAAELKGGTFDVATPISGARIAALQRHDPADVTAAIARAVAAFRPGERSPRRGAANWCACSARNCARRSGASARW